eukprot:TRINITY_DN15711_c0_g1_i1.p1 TRINITY_DN15711_c0_g1~~TRINITY_DN15711_c0_g1_i1.p1  ORF type:complete len:241 (+),score=20.42 TRINITY_DN15711_c0_g1_i1:94-816(+)
MPKGSKRPIPRIDQAYVMTKMCMFHAVGRCKRGSACKFAHQEEDLRPQLDLSKTRPCKYFLSGSNCANGRACRFAHGSFELRDHPHEQSPSLRQRGPAPLASSTGVEDTASLPYLAATSPQVLEPSPDLEAGELAETCSDMFADIDKPIAINRDATFEKSDHPRPPMRKGQHAHADLARFADLNGSPYSSYGETGQWRLCQKLLLGGEEVTLVISKTFFEVAVSEPVMTRCHSAPGGLAL